MASDPKFPNVAPKQPTMTSKDMIVNQEVTVVSQKSQQDLQSIPITQVGEGFDPSILDSAETAATEEFHVDAETTKVAQSTETEAGGDKEVEQGKEDLASAISQGQINIRDLDPKDLDNFMSESIIARPIRMPNMLDLRSKDPNYRLRWVNFKTRGGARFDEAVAQGFIKVTEPREIIGLNTHLMIHKDGIKYHDVILMKIKTETLFGAYKYNVLRSAKMVSNQGVQQLAAQQANTTLRKGISEQGFSYSGELATKIGVYIPNAKESSNV